MRSGHFFPTICEWQNTFLAPYTLVKEKNHVAGHEPYYLRRAHVKDSFTAIVAWTSKTAWGHWNTITLWVGSILLQSFWIHADSSAKSCTQRHTNPAHTDGGCVLQRPWMCRSTDFLNAKRHSVSPLLSALGWKRLYLTSFIPPYLAMHFYSNNQCSNQSLINPLMSPFGLQLTANISSSPLME